MDKDQINRIVINANYAYFQLPITEDENGMSIWCSTKRQAAGVKRVLKAYFPNRIVLHDMVREGDMTHNEWRSGADRWRLDINY